MTGGTIDVAVYSHVVENINLHILISGFPVSPGSILHQDCHTVRMPVERPVLVHGAHSLNLQSYSTYETEGGGGGPVLVLPHFH